MGRRSHFSGGWLGRVVSGLSVAINLDGTDTGLWRPLLQASSFMKQDEQPFHGPATGVSAAPNTVAESVEGQFDAFPTARWAGHPAIAG